MKSLFKRVIVSVLTWEAKCVLKKYRPKIVAVTGSVGKTGTKDAVYTLLSATAFTRKSEKSFNSEFGVPLTILGLPTAWSNPFGWIENVVEGLLLLLKTQPYPEWLVLEVGADRPGDIQSLSWLAPHMVILTRFPDVPVHVEYFDSPEQVIEEKRALKRALRGGGTLIVNHDDPLMRDEVVLEGQQVIRYGFTETGAAVWANEYEVRYEDGKPVGVSFMVHFQDEHVRLDLPGTLGAPHLYALLAALSVGIAEGVSFSRAVSILRTHQPPAGRMRILEGLHHATIIDDSYNASPVAAEVGLTTCKSITVSGKKIVVLGDMMELGEFSVDEHRKVGEHVADVAHVFVAVGVRMLGAAEAVRAKRGVCTRVEAVKDAREAAELLPALVEPGDLIYVKGSQSNRLERVVEALLLDPANAPNVLVRQDIEWKKR